MRALSVLVVATVVLVLTTLDQPARLRSLAQGATPVVGI